MRLMIVVAAAAILAPTVLTAHPAGAPGAANAKVVATDVSAEVMSYINRLSDFLFVASRYLNDKGARDVLWVPGANR